MNVEPLDSDSDPEGASNLLEILMHTQPGWTPGPVNTIFFKDGTTLSGQPPPADRRESGPSPRNDEHDLHVDEQQDEHVEQHEQLEHFDDQHDAARSDDDHLDEYDFLDVDLLPCSSPEHDPPRNCDRERGWNLLRGPPLQCRAFHLPLRRRPTAFHR